MNKNRIAIAIASVAMVLVVIGIAVMSVGLASKGGYMQGFGGFSFGGGVAELRNTIEIPLDQVQDLNVDYGSENLKLFKGDSDKIVIKEYLVNDRKDALAKVDISNGVATVTGPKQIIVNIFSFAIDERIEIYLPESGLANVSLATGSGNISVETGYAGQYEGLAVATGSGNIHWSNCDTFGAAFAAGSGNIKLEDMAGDLALSAGSGNLTMDNLTGEVDAKCGSGNITIENLTGSGKMHASSGNVKVFVSELTGDIQLYTGSGNAKLEIPKDTAGHVELSTGSGTINTDYDDQLSYNKDGEQADGDIGSNPVNQIAIDTGSGNVHLLSH